MDRPDNITSLSSVAEGGELVACKSERDRREFAVQAAGKHVVGWVRQCRNLDGGPPAWRSALVSKFRAGRFVVLIRARRESRAPGFNTTNFPLPSCRAAAAACLPAIGRARPRGPVCRRVSRQNQLTGRGHRHLMQAPAFELGAPTRPQVVQRPLARSRGYPNGHGTAFETERGAGSGSG